MMRKTTREEHAQAGARKYVECASFDDKQWRKAFRENRYWAMIVQKDLEELSEDPTVEEAAKRFGDHAFLTDLKCQACKTSVDSVVVLTPDYGMCSACLKNALAMLEDGDGDA